MKKKKIVLACVFAAMSSLMVAGPASAAHCTDEGPGHSYFGKVHTVGNNGPGGHDEGDHKGYSSCNPSGK